MTAYNTPLPHQMSNTKKIAGAKVEIAELGCHTGQGTNAEMCEARRLELVSWQSGPDRIIKDARNIFQGANELAIVQLY